MLLEGCSSPAAGVSKYCTSWMGTNDSEDFSSRQNQLAHKGLSQVRRMILLRRLALRGCAVSFG